MKPKKFQKLLSLNKQTIADLNTSEQSGIKAGNLPKWTLPIETQCVPAHYTECGLNCEATDYTCDTCQVTCHDLISGAGC